MKNLTLRRGLAAFVVFAIVFASFLPSLKVTTKAEEGNPTTIGTSIDDTVRIEVSFDGEAGIPEGAELFAEELLPGSLAYAAHLEASAEVMGKEDPDSISFARFFDIEIRKDGEKVELQVPVSVKIDIADAPAATREDLTVVHFEEGNATPVVMDAESAEDAEVVFETESFSVYGILTETLPTSADDLDGWKVTIDRDGRFITSNVNYNVGSGPFRLGKSSNANEAAVWTIEKSGANYGYTFYNISTVVNGEKRYLHMDRVWNNYDAAHTTLETPASASGCPQDFAFDLNEDGTYTLFIVLPQYDWTRYNLNEWEGYWGNGFAGYRYRTNDDHFHLNFQTSQPLTETPNENPLYYAVIVKNKENDTYYAVQNDGSLVPVEYDEDTGRARVKLETPFVWSYISAHDGLNGDTTGTEYDQWLGYGPYNIRASYDARGYDSGTQLKQGDYYRYISPVSDDGIYSEDEEHPYHGGGNMDGAKGDNAIIFEDHHVHGVVWVGDHFENTAYIGVNSDYTHITGNQTETNAATIFFAIIEDVPPAPSGSYSNNETVNHIDIGIDSTAVLHFPLAYGKYYDKDKNLLFEVTPENLKTITATQTIPVTKEDIMDATLTAYETVTGEDGKDTLKKIDDAYYISGYSANDETGHSTVQVRMEGSFKVSTLGQYTGSYDRSNDDPQRRADRLKNQVTYEVSTVLKDKTVTFDIMYDDGKKKLTQVYDNRGNPLSVTVTDDFEVSAQFSYWSKDDDLDDEEYIPNNECPAVQDDFEDKYSWLVPDGAATHRGRNNRNWQAGAIIDNDYTMPGGRDPYPAESGMDFILKVDVNIQNESVAVNITKTIIDQDGNIIHPNTDITNNFTVYQKDATQAAIDGVGNGYAVTSPVDEDDAGLADKQTGFAAIGDPIEIIVGEDGTEIYHDYDVAPGMIYIEEDAAPMAKGGKNYTITDKDGKVWTYVETRVETEYVWRNDDYSGKSHVVNGMTAVPDVLGDYQFEDWQEGYPHDKEGNPIDEDGNIVTTPRNGFLEFRVYNVYTIPEEPEQPKTGDSNNLLPYLLAMLAAGVVITGAALIYRKTRKNK